MQKYVIGFMRYDENVLLIKKNKPEWQKGKYNGIGGKIEENESPLIAMHREFLEEAGLEFPIDLWRNTIIQIGNNYELHVFAAIGDIYKAQQMEEEELVIVSINNLHYHPVIPNLRWIIPMSFDQEIIFPIKIEVK